MGDAPEDQAVAYETGVSFIGRDSGKALDDTRDPVFSDMAAVLQNLTSRE